MSNNINYYVTIDSQFRNRDKYAIPTDFGVSFQTQNPNINYPQGEPIDTSQFFPRVTIDKNFVSSKLTVLNGPLTNVVYNNTNKKYIYTGHL
jgi:hypothetical protein